MTKFFTTTALALALACPAQAQSPSTTTTRCHGSDCTSTTTPLTPSGALPGDANPLPPTDRQAHEDKVHESEWTVFCNPVLGPPNKNGLQAWQYAHPGCDTGRTE
jgi:hypothetical protein